MCDERIKELIRTCELGLLLEEKYYDSKDGDDDEFQAMLGVFTLSAKSALSAMRSERMEK